VRSWLFAFGGGIRHERPDALRQELVERCRQAIEANGRKGTPLSVTPGKRLVLPTDYGGHSPFG
jgi:hypothetical protein